MHIVIDIPDEMYMDIKEEVRTKVNTFEHIPFLHEVISVGTPLPKGHGRLGDLDALREEVSSWGMNDYEPSDFTDEIDKADTIIEADKEVNADEDSH